MSSSYQRAPEIYYTYLDVLDWDEDVRAEIIDGKLYMMAPPSPFHQWVSRELLVQLYTFLKGKPCEVFAAPFGVRLFPRADKQDDTFVEPDLAVVCDPAKMDKHGYNGAPTLLIEILSPSTAWLDRGLKLQKYLAAGVQEYWIVNPEQETVLVHIFEQGQYHSIVYHGTDTLPVSVLPGCVINLAEVFSAGQWASEGEDQERADERRLPLF